MPEIIIMASVGLAGLAFGSFVTLLSYRLPRGEAIGFTRSRCPACDTVLRVRDLMPVLSWVWRRGRCGHCGAPVHWRYPAIELITAATFMLLYLRFGLTPVSLTLMALSVCLVAMAVIDLEHGILPDALQWGMAALAVGYRWATPDTDWLTAIYGAGIGLTVALALRWGYAWVRRREGLGLGDVKFMFVAGLWLGSVTLVPFLFFSGVYGICTGVLWRLLGKGEVFPFGPALMLALATCLLFPGIGGYFVN